MWIMTSDSYLSVCAEAGRTDLSIRARSAEDLDHFREHYCPELGETRRTHGRDYGWRAAVSHDDFGDALKRVVVGVPGGPGPLCYERFKDTVAPSRFGPYLSVWQSLTVLQEGGAYS